MSVIEHVQGREVLDSRGNPTVEVDVQLAAAPGGDRPPAPAPASARRWSCATATARSGARACQGRRHVNGEIPRAVPGWRPTDQAGSTAR